MVDSHRKKALSEFCRILFVSIIVLIIAANNCIAANTLKLVETPLSQFIELYSQETGRNVFIDEGVQQQRRISAQLQGMPIEKAFDIIKMTLGLESCLVGTDTILLFPPERAQRYRPGLKTLLLKLPAGVDQKWVSTLLIGVLPMVKTVFAPGDERSLVLFGPNDQIESVQALTKTFPEIAVKRETLAMCEAEAKLAVKEIRVENIEAEAGPFGISWRGRPELVKAFEKELNIWRKITAWETDVFTPEFLEPQKVLRAAEAAKGRTIVADLGGTGSILVEGPCEARKRLIEILQTLDRQARTLHREITLGELKPEVVKDAVKGTGISIERGGEKGLVLFGRENAVNEAEKLLKALDRKRRQVFIRFRLAEVSRSRMKNLGIDLDKSVYSYGEIKEFHPKDTLPLLLKVLNEGKDGRILAEPNLRVLESEEAKVIIGDRIPLEVAATAQTDSGSTLKLNTQLSWVDVGIKMSVKNVTVTPDGSIRMGLKSEVSSVVSLTKQGYPQIRTREAESILRVIDGESVIMGGLLSQEDRENRYQIPWISKLPLVGGFTRNREKQKTETEIIMIVTAKIADEW